MGWLRPSATVVPRLPRRQQVTLWDRSARPRVLPMAWWAGSLVDGGHSYGARSPEGAYMALYNHRDRHGPLRSAMVWCHGRGGKLLWGDSSLDLAILAHALGGDLDWLWLRTCNFADRPDAMESLADMLGCDVYAHDEVVSAPNALYQEGVRGVSPGCRATWANAGPDADAAPRANILQMRPDTAWLQCAPAAENP